MSESTGNNQPTKDLPTEVLVSDIEKTTGAHAEHQPRPDQEVNRQRLDDLPEEIKTVWNDVTARSAARADEILEAHGHYPGAYSRYKQHVAREAELVGPALAHRAWDIPVYGEKSTLEAYLETRGLSALASDKLSKPATTENSDITTAVSEIQDVEQMVAEPNSSPTIELKKEIKRIQNSKLGRFMVNQVRKIHFQFYSPRPTGPIEEQPPLNEQLTFDFDAPMPAAKTETKVASASTKEAAKSELKLPEVNLDNSWKGMDPMDDAEPSTAEVTYETKPQTNEVVEPLVETKKSGKPTAVKEFLNGMSKAKQESKRHKVKRITATFLGALAIGYIGYTAGNNNAQTIRQNSDNLWAQIEAQDQPQQSENSSEAPSLNDTPEVPVDTEQIVPETTPEEPVVTERTLEPSPEPIAPIDLSRIHDGPGLPQPLVVFEVQENTSVANAIGNYAHNFQGIDLTDAQKQQVYNQLTAEFGDNIIDIQNDDENVVKVGSDLFFSSTGKARLFNESVKIRLDELVREALAP